jgi:hypothetical protein
MDIYYVDSSISQKYNMQNIALKGDMTARQISSEILRIPRFCREETSINASDLVSYLFNGIVFYIVNEDGLKGVLTFDINGDSISIYGLCSPNPSIGAGSKLMNAVKKFAELNGIKQIKLTCYGDVIDFYTKNGFIIKNKSIISKESDSQDESVPITRYDLMYITGSSGGKRRRKSRRMKKKCKRKRKTRKYYH